MFLFCSKYHKSQYAEREIFNRRIQLDVASTQSVRGASEGSRAWRSLSTSSATSEQQRSNRRGMIAQPPIR